MPRVPWIPAQSGLDRRSPGTLISYRLSLKVVLLIFVSQVTKLNSVRPWMAEATMGIATVVADQIAMLRITQIFRAMLPQMAVAMVSDLDPGIIQTQLSMAMRRVRASIHPMGTNNHTILWRQHQMEAMRQISGEIRPIQAARTAP